MHPTQTEQSEQCEFQLSTAAACLPCHAHPHHCSYCCDQMISVADEAHMDPDEYFHRGNVPKKPNKIWCIIKPLYRGRRTDPASNTKRAPLHAKRPNDTREWRPQTHTDIDINTQTHIWRLTHSHKGRWSQTLMNTDGVSSLLTHPLGDKRGLKTVRTVSRSWVLAGGEAAAADAWQASLDTQRWRINQT